jgi:antitoxin ParD1/3/4
MPSDSINVRMDESLMNYIDGFINPNGPYESRSEFLRDIVRRDKERREKEEIKQSILQGYVDWAEGRYIESSGDLRKDLETFRKKEKEGWL